MKVRTLVGRLILSHVLPLLVVLGLVGVALNYVLETRFLLSNLGGELTGRAVLLAELAGDRPQVWTDPARAQDFVERAGSPLSAQVMLIDAAGRLLASSDPAHTAGAESALQNMSEIEQVLEEGQVVVNTGAGRQPRSDVIEVLVPAWGPDRRVVGAVRLTQPLENVSGRFMTLRYLIGGVLAVGVLLGGGFALFLGRNLGHSLRQVTETIHRLANREQLDTLPEQGPQEIRQLLQAVNTLVERLQDLEENRRHLLSNLVHDLSNPLGALRSATNALLGGAGEDESLRRELLVGMQKEEERLERLLADLDGLYDRLLGSLELQKHPLDLDDMLRHTLAPWREAARDKGLRWQTNLPPALPSIRADEDRLRQAIGNLLSNAIKYTPENGTVSVSAGRRADAVWIRIEDTGPGITIREQSHIFQPFYRGTSNRRFADGMGLGLSIAQDLVTAHGGRLEVTSVPGKGSEFTIWLPLSGAST